MRPRADEPLRIAYLTYRGKPHVGGQGVYTRHLTKALVDLVWAVAKKLGYADIFVDESSAVEDDHQSFLKRHVPSVDVIDLDNGPTGDVYYWHTPQDSLDKISPKTLAVVGHVFLESVKQLQGK